MLEATAWKIDELNKHKVHPIFKGVKVANLHILPPMKATVTQSSTHLRTEN